MSLIHLLESLNKWNDENSEENLVLASYETKIPLFSAGTPEHTCQVTRFEVRLPKPEYLLTSKLSLKLGLTRITKD